MRLSMTSLVEGEGECWRGTSRMPHLWCVSAMSERSGASRANELGPLGVRATESPARTEGEPPVLLGKAAIAHYGPSGSGSLSLITTSPP